MKKYLNGSFDLTTMVDFYDEWPIWSAPFGLKLLDKIEYKRGITALDIGFGSGFPLIELAQRLGESTTVYGIDPWKDAIRRVQRKISYFNISNIRIIEGHAESIPLENHSVDLIVSNNGINNVSDMGKVLSECSRIIKTGGQFVQTLNLDKSMVEFYAELEAVLEEMHMSREIDLMRQHIYEKRRPLDEILFLLRENSFVLKDLEHDQFCYKFTDGSAMLNHSFIRLAFMDSWKKLLPADKVEPVFEEVELRLNEKSRMLGGMKLSIPFVLINAIKR
ncbi:MAG: methyltransferase domain-containing protein [Bacteroidales bacterium]|nr:methyltransferase domain-containing protein [Bacteroidales bacterium]